MYILPSINGLKSPLVHYSLRETLLNFSFPSVKIPIMAGNKIINFTQGNLKKEIIAFSVPLFLGNLFQQLYNTADSLIVGNTLGAEALASVASSGSLIFMMTGFFQGVATGAGVVIGKYIGANDKEKVEKAIHTDLAFGLTAGIILTIFA